MNPRLRAALAVLVILVVANYAWRAWESRGLITIDADGAPLAEVVRSIGKQGGVQLATNAPADAKVTMHVRKVPLLRALEVLSSAAGASWSIGYLAAPDKTAIRVALMTLASGEELTGWKKFTFAVPGMPGGLGGSDPREEKWDVTAAPDGRLQGYLAEGSQSVNAQFWTPEDWNPAVPRAPASGKVGDVVRGLAKASKGESEEVFLVLVRSVSPPPGMAGGSGRPPGVDGGMGRGGPMNEGMRAAIEKRMRAQIDTLPAEKKAAALAEFEGRKKFFEEMASLPPEERAQKMRSAMEQEMQSGRMETRMTQMGAMRTAEERTNFYRMVVKGKAEAAAK